ncbi:MAG: secretion system protein E, partial [Gammaproteobacteria bacterium]|nr:secretion system protein E [Gammaproteobacteria bacterium]
TNSALGTIPRLLDIGVKPSIIAGNIIGVIGQRLVRRLCPHCKQPYEPNALEKRMIYSTALRSTIVPIYRSAGCRMCDMSGYKGRVALMEVLRFNSEIDELIASNSTMRELKKTATANGFKTLANDGARRVREGVTSLEEVSRMVDLTQLLGED